MKARASPVAIITTINNHFEIMRAKA